jgi:hypothetical protein
VILVGAVALGMVVSALCGARLADWKRVHLRFESVLLVLLVFSSVASSTAASDAKMSVVLKVTWLACLGGSVFIALANRRHPGMVLLGVGLLLNLAVISANWGMPVIGAVQAGVQRRGAPVIASTDRIHVPLTSRSRLAALGDVVSLPVYGSLRALMSPGDVLLLTGLTAFVAAASLHAHREGLRVWD